MLTSLGDDAGLRLAVEKAPLIDLDSKHFKTVAAFDAHFPHGAPSLRDASSLTVKGDWTFGADVTVTGDASLADEGEARTVEAGATLAG
ncbi:hypothetical protein GCM10025876_20680 [Demequina litorisediminis]|uniref:Uncharacterized protein n=1 Tax=Demequina litorisediminis TaxID=1849022 RepID=A0ABQ6IGM5_9MICO|nr:hypothetical protein GCM10025876_20680 [Demequina litorisediminis]